MQGQMMRPFHQMRTIQFSDNGGGRRKLDHTTCMGKCLFKAVTDFKRERLQIG